MFTAIKYFRKNYKEPVQSYIIVEYTWSIPSLRGKRVFTDTFRKSLVKRNFVSIFDEFRAKLIRFLSSKTSFSSNNRINRKFISCTRKKEKMKQDHIFTKVFDQTGKKLPLLEFTRRNESFFRFLKSFTSIKKRFILLCGY